MSKKLGLIMIIILPIMAILLIRARRKATLMLDPGYRNTDQLITNAIQKAEDTNRGEIGQTLDVVKATVQGNVIEQLIKSVPLLMGVTVPVTPSISLASPATITQANNLTIKPYDQSSAKTALMERWGDL